MATRDELIKNWLNEKIGGNYEYRPASEDASFRRYFRVQQDANTWILMDAPPDKEDSKPFVRVAQLLASVDVNVPRIHEQDLGQGFLLLSDLGDEQYLSHLNPNSVQSMYADALEALFAIQSKAPLSWDGESLPPYDRAMLLREMELFREWYVGKHLGFNLTEQQHQALDHVFGLLAESALAQPQVFVHRDYHSRNLMLTPHDNPGIIDFQDAVVGAISYDLVSLLRDCYIAWPRQQVETWALDYLHRCMDAKLFAETEDKELLRWFDFMGVQRHLKASGIFARLKHRDGKHGYIKDIPRTLDYVKDVASRYSQLQPLQLLLDALSKAA